MFADADGVLEESKIEKTEGGFSSATYFLLPFLSSLGHH